jgi:hypothetical protein
VQQVSETGALTFLKRYKLSYDDKYLWDRQ